MTNTMKGDQKAVDVRLDVVGSRLVGVDLFSDGSESCLRQNLGTYESPEHAEAFKLLMSRPDFFILASEGKITDEVMDKLAAALVKLKEKHGTQAKTTA